MRRSANAFMEAGNKHAHFATLLLGASAALVAGAAAGASYVKGMQAKLVILEAELQRSREEARLRVEHARQEARLGIAAATALAVKETSDKFLLYGYAEEYRAFQEKALGKKNG